MSRSHVSPIKQPDEDSCGPAALRMALSILGKRTSIAKLIELCGTSRNGTTTKNMIRAIQKLRLPALVVEKTTLTHVLSALRTSSLHKRAVIVSYLYAMDDENNPIPDSGHWAVVSSYRANTSRIVLLDSYTGQKTSYPWMEFRRRWIDETFKRRKLGSRGSKYKLIRKPERQLMIVVSTNTAHLPKFRMASAHVIGSTRVN